MKNFNYWKKLHDSEQLSEFSTNTIGLLWLKTKSIVRKELITEFITANSITLKETALGKQFVELFELLCKNATQSHQILDDYIKQKNKNQVAELNTEQLVSELYKLENFDWGGDYQNSLDKYLVSRYVKIHKSYDMLVSKFETEINVAVQGYVLNSWYNHWSSILIEHIFKSHSAVLPTVGQIKNVDFFINDIPFDLKVTYLPAEYIKEKRKEKYLKIAYSIALEYAEKNDISFTKIDDFGKEVRAMKESLNQIKPKTSELEKTLKKIEDNLNRCVELTFLKNKATEAKITFDKKAKDADIFYEIVEKMKDKNDEFCINVLTTLKNEKLKILKEAQESPKILAKWLYENQGEMRFGSENRLFLVLVDTEDFNNSWKLKRNLDLLKPIIIDYLDNFTSKKLDDLQIDFSYKGKPKPFTALTDIIFVVK